MGQTESMQNDLGTRGRSVADVATLLLELGRAAKGWAFYPPEHPARADLLDRTYRAWHAELRRSGPVELLIRRGAFWLPGAENPLTTRADDTARQLYLRSVRRVIFDAELNPPTLSAFLDVIAMEPDALAMAGGVEEAFYTGPRHGIQVNEADWRALLDKPRVEDTLEVDEADLGSLAFADGDADAGEDRDGSQRECGQESDDTAQRVALGLLGAAVLAAEEADADAAVDPAIARADELESILSQLEECDDDRAYRDLARNLASLAEQMSGAGELDGVFAVFLALARHASDDAKRSFSQRESASGFLGQMAHGPALEHLIDRAVDVTTASSIEATTALRELGPRVAPILLDRLEIEMDPERRGRLAGVLIAMGDESVPALVEALTHGSKRRMKVSLRLAGETQNPRLVECLRETLLSGEKEIARDAAQALVRVGDLSSLDVLTEALHSNRPDVAALAAYSLGATGRVLALAPLRDALARALDAGQLSLAREVVRGLGRMGRPEAVPALIDVLDRGGWFRRKQLGDVKLAAIGALAHLPGADAEAALSRLLRSRNTRLRDAATAALRRQALEGIAAGRPREVA
jgi:HEAT repeat protein